MTDQTQAARIAAMRAKRGQPPVAIPTVSTPPAPTALASTWAPPSAAAAFIAAPPQGPAPTGRTTQRSRAKGPRRPHVAAGARIFATGLAASGVFGLTTVIAAASQPSAPAAVAPAAATTVPAVTVPPTVATQPAPTVVLSVPTIPAPTTVAAEVAVPTPAPAAATPAKAAPKANAPAPAAARQHRHRPQHRHRQQRRHRHLHQPRHRHRRQHPLQWQLRHRPPRPRPPPRLRARPSHSAPHHPEGLTRGGSMSALNEPSMHGPVALPPPTEPLQRDFRVMGCRAHIVVHGGTTEMLDAAEQRLHELESLWSRFLDDSDITRANQAAGRPVRRTRRHACRREPGTRRVAPDRGPIRHHHAARHCSNRDTPTVPSRALPRRAVPGTKVGLSACVGSITPSRRLTVPATTAIDLGGIGKGFAADIVAEELIEAGALGVARQPRR